MERRWLGLARSWQFSEQLDTFSKHNKKPGKEAEEASKKLTVAAERLMKKRSHREV
jgi:hypothetical protein